MSQEADRLLQLAAAAEERDAELGLQQQRSAPRDLLPNPADVMRDVLKVKTEVNPALFNETRRSSTLADMTEDMGVITECFRNRLTGRTVLEKFKIYFHSWWYKSNLLLTLQSVRSVGQSCLAADTLAQYTWMEKWRLYEGNSASANLVSHTGAFKMYQMFVAIFLLQSRKHILYESTKFEEDFSDDDRSALLAVRRASRPPPPQVKGADYKAAKQATFVDAERDNYEQSCPMHPDWVEHDVRLINVLVDDVIKYKMKDTRSAEQQTQVQNIWTEHMIMSIYRSFVSTVTGVLEDQYEIASTLQTKLLGAVATLAFAAVNFLFKIIIAPQIEFNYEKVGNLTLV